MKMHGLDIIIDLDISINDIYEPHKHSWHLACLLEVVIIIAQK